MHAGIRRLRPAALVAAAPLLMGVACAKGPLDGERSSLAAAEARWKASGPRDYTFDIRRMCFCPFVPTLRVVVRGSEPVSAVDATTGAPVDTALFRDLLTVDRVFAHLRDILDRRPAKFDVEYDAQLGYPRRADLDPIANAIDDEQVIQIVALTPQGAR